jgi:hypothetical protein
MLGSLRERQLKLILKSHMRVKGIKSLKTKPRSFREDNRNPRN